MRISKLNPFIWHQTFLQRRCGKITVCTEKIRSKIGRNACNVTHKKDEQPISHGFRIFVMIMKLLFIGHLSNEYFYSIPQPTIGASMLPTLQVLGDQVLIARSFRRGRGIQVGDVVSFASVIKPRERVIKRIIGMPGDWVLRDTPPGSPNSQMIQVPDGHCWVVGDNLEYSRDSRHYGPVPLALINGKVIAVVFPWKERRWIENSLKSVHS